MTDKQEEQQNNVKEHALSGLVWTFLERFGAQCVTFIVSIILARLLDPVVFGTVAIVTVLMEILNVFIDSGLGSALIQKKDADDLDFSSVFYFNIFMCVLLYFLLFFIAPLIAGFYDIPELTSIIRVMGLTLIISGVRNVQRAFVSRNLQFKRFFFSTLGGTVGSAILGIWMAYRSCGVWALVAQSLFSNIVGTAILWLTVKWRPKPVFSFKRFCGLFTFGWKLLVSSLINTVYNNLRQLIIGKMYSTQSLAMYNRGYMIPNVIVINVNSAIDSVLFPVMSSAQDDVASVRAMTRRSISISSYVMWPLMLGLAACSTPLVSVLLTDKWLPCVPFLIIFCITYAFLPLQTANLNAIKALGHSEIYLRLEIIKEVIGFAILAATMWFGPLVMAASNLLFTVINYLINAFPTRRLLNYSYSQQIADIAPPMLLSAFMFGIVYCVRFLELSNWLTLLIQIPLGILIYVGGSMLFKLESFTYILNTIKGLVKKN